MCSDLYFYIQTWLGMVAKQTQEHDLRNRNRKPHVPTFSGKHHKNHIWFTSAAGAIFLYSFFFGVFLRRLCGPGESHSMTHRMRCQNSGKKGHQVLCFLVANFCSLECTHLSPKNHPVPHLTPANLENPPWKLTAVYTYIHIYIYTYIHIYIYTYIHIHI